METLDLSDFETAEEAAKALHEWLRDLAEEMDQDPDLEVSLYAPEEAAAKRNGHAAWTVSWEGGPYEWAYHLTSGESLAYSDLPGSIRPGKPEVTGFYDQDAWIAEPYYSFDLQFRDQT